MEKFNKAFEYMMHNEGGFVNDPSDSGGATKFGITQKSLSYFRKRDVSLQEVQELTLDDAKAFYYETFYKPMHLDSINDQAIVTALFDIGVNQGSGTVIKMAQFITNQEIDGIMGPKTAAAINKCETQEFLRHFKDQVQDRYNIVIKTNPKNEKFANGWANRANKILTLA